MESWFGADLNRKERQRTFFLLPGTVEYGVEADEDLEQEQAINDGMDHLTWWNFRTGSSSATRRGLGQVCGAVRCMEHPWNPLNEKCMFVAGGSKGPFLG